MSLYALIYFDGHMSCLSIFLSCKLKLELVYDEIGKLKIETGANCNFRVENWSMCSNFNLKLECICALVSVLKWKAFWNESVCYSFRNLKRKQECMCAPVLVQKLECLLRFSSRLHTLERCERLSVVQHSVAVNDWVCVCSLSALAPVQATIKIILNRCQRLSSG